MTRAALVRIAAVQMNSGDDLQQNLHSAAHWVAEAVARGASFVLLPEYFCLMGKTDAERVALGESPAQGPIQAAMAALARQHGIWLSAGTLPLISPEPGKVFNSNLLFDPEGRCAGRYDKIHLFGFDNGDECYAESRILAAGQEVVTFETSFGRVRPSVCYDLRFPELYRQAGGFSLLTAPAAFTYTTGEAHWALLLRCRAVENQCYVLAAAQTGWHPGGQRTYGHSMIVDPWGRVLDCLADGEGVVCADLDLDYLGKVRSQLPALNNRVLF
ncbi:carbon-nitrogen hydrolase family protein [Pseudaeromonas sp. ZJS20]|uniref:carbon-nitrogen hydrolase family protein n=1 Tax=Pseudaeromonas aegiceratis TaxID=3153928 RepID=UPI00390C5FD6